VTDLPEISEADRQFMALHFRERSAGPNSQFERWADILYPKPKTLYERALAAYADGVGIDVETLGQSDKDAIRNVLRTVKDALDGLDAGDHLIYRSDVDDMFRGGELDD